MIVDTEVSDLENKLRALKMKVGSGAFSPQDQLAILDAVLILCKRMRAADDDIHQIQTKMKPSGGLTGYIP